MLTSLLDVCCGLEAKGNWVAAARATLWLALGYIYDGFVNMNYSTVHAVQQSIIGRTHIRGLSAFGLARACL